MLHQKKGIFPGLLLLFLLISGGWLLHEFYVSLTEIRYNPHTERFEVSMRIFPDDLDRALLERSGLHTHLATELEHSFADSLLSLYILEDFALEVNGEKLSLNYLGKEPESDAIWCYLESSRVSAPETITVQNAILMEYFPDQLNMIQVYLGKWNKGLMLDRDQRSGRLLIPGS
ncbi:MAG: hypothetical protein P1P86_03785 [Bacteroidales bacterium]|nr:hypothetical protein [Bacteroidales bacterium]